MIEQLVAQINADLNWGTIDTWTNKDFERLSERVWVKTHKRLSVTTLKRIWGRAERISQPSQTTLDILAEFAGFESWRDFTQQQEETKYAEQSEAGIIPSRFSRFAILGILLVGVGITFILWNQQSESAFNPHPRLKPEGFIFKKTVVADEIPNSVVFAYDASVADPSAVIEIQQDWDIRKRIPLKREDSIATCIYYRPGHFKAKLVVDSQIVAEDDVLIQTKNWLGIVEQDPVPLYLPNEVVNKGTDIAISSEALKPYDVDPMQEDIISCLYKISDLGPLFTDDFIFNMEVRHTLDKARRRCKGVQIYLIFDGGAISIPLANKGCVANLDIMTFEEFVSGKTTDLSDFGVDMDVWQKVQMDSKKGSLEIFLNEQSVYKMSVSSPALAIKGVSVYFEGTGKIRNVKFSNSTGREVNL
ncbi:MAG: hypothetical protein AAFR87_31680 [Bacteroidota bacterium]